MLTPPQVRELRAMIESNEGRKRHPYKDTAGKLTIVGRNLTDNGLTDAEVDDELLDHDIDDALLFLTSYPWFSTLNSARQMALADLMFNVGPHAFSLFKEMLTALSICKFDLAADAMLDSAWAHEVPSRAYRDARIMLTGELP